MQDITFYNESGKPSAPIELAEDFYKRLATSDFTEIGASHKIKVKVDEEEPEIEAIYLNKGTISNRQRLIDFLTKEICEESKKMIDKLGDVPSTEEYQTQSYALKKFHEILASVEDKKHYYLQRLT